MTTSHATKPLGIVDLLVLRGFDRTRPAKLVRHQSAKYDVHDLMRRGWFEHYQATQKRPVFDHCERIISFIGSGGTKARFIGVYRVNGRSDPRRHIPSPAGFPPDYAKTVRYLYDLEREAGYEDLENRVVIEWGKGTRSWVQRLSNKEIVELLPKGQLRPPFRDYLEFTLTHAELKELHEHEDANREWRARLAAVAGIYLILATKTGAQYIGSAHGSEGFGVGGRLMRVMVTAATSCSSVSCARIPRIRLLSPTRSFKSCPRASPEARCWNGSSGTRRNSAAGPRGSMSIN